MKSPVDNQRPEERETPYVHRAVKIGGRFGKGPEGPVEVWEGRGCVVGWGTGEGDGPGAEKEGLVGCGREGIREGKGRGRGTRSTYMGEWLEGLRLEG